MIRSYALSLGVFFGLLLIYLYAGYSIVGDISFLEPTDKNFRRLALTLGAVAFASGYWFEDMKESLERRVKHHEGF